MNILCIGDVVASSGCNFLREHLPNIKKNENIDVVIANGENSADGNGITPHSAEHLFTSGVDIITTGNHAFRRREIYKTFDNNPYLIRPCNYSSDVPGKGYCMLDRGRVKIYVINVLGTVFMESLESPFDSVQNIINKIEDKIIILDCHAEATAEKRALAYYFDGKISAFFGTHTHVQTADETILPNGTGYITDVGMTGAVNSVLGIKIEQAITKMKTKMPVRFESVTTGKITMDCILYNIDEKTGKTILIKRIKI